MKPEIFEEHYRQYQPPTKANAIDLRRDLRNTCAELPEEDWTKADELLIKTEQYEKDANVK